MGQQARIAVVEQRTDLAQAHWPGSDPRPERTNGRGVSDTLVIDAEEELRGDVIGEHQMRSVVVVTDERARLIVDDHDSHRRARAPLLVDAKVRRAVDPDTGKRWRLDAHLGRLTAWRSHLG